MFYYCSKQMKKMEENWVWVALKQVFFVKIEEFLTDVIEDIVDTRRTHIYDVLFPSFLWRFWWEWQFEPLIYLPDEVYFESWWWILQGNYLIGHKC